MIERSKRLESGFLECRGDWLILVHSGIGVGFRLDVEVASALLFVGLAQMLLLVLLVVFGGVALIALEAKG